jgi:hypothetical protein
MSHPVEVNLNVNIDASGTINVFGYVPETHDNIVDCSLGLAVAALYDVAKTGVTIDASSQLQANSFFEFMEKDSSFGSIEARLSAAEGRDYKVLVKSFVNGLHASLRDKLDATAAEPFNNAKYTLDSQRKSDNFGRLALRVYADHLFGHIDATAAITNDVDFMNFMNGPDVNVDPSNGVITPDSSKASLAARLVKAVIESGNNITEIAKQVIGQDATRTMDDDNNELAPGNWHPLQFRADDILYMKINLQAPNVTISQGQQYEKPTTAMSTISYTIKVKLV